MYICFVLFLDCERDIDTDEMNDDIDMKNDRFADCLFSCPKKAVFATSVFGCQYYIYGCRDQGLVS